MKVIKKVIKVSNVGLCLFVLMACSQTQEVTNTDKGTLKGQHYNIKTESSFNKTPTLLNDFDWSVWDVEGGTNDISPVVGNTLVFDALKAKHSTPNGNGWRHELKIKKKKRVAMTEVYEDFKASIKVDLSPGSKTIVVQHHASDTGTIMKLYVSDTSELGFKDSIANNGVFDVYVRLAKEDGSGEAVKSLGKLRSGDSFDFHVINDHGYVQAFAFEEQMKLTIKDDSKSFLKFGNYLQAQDSVTRKKIKNSTLWSKFYKQADINQSQLTFSNISYIRKVD